MTNDIPTGRMTQVSSFDRGKSQVAKLETGSTTKIESQKQPESGKDSSLQLVGSTVTEAQLSNAVGQINDYVQTVQRDLSFSMDESSGQTVIKVIDSESGEVLRQIPSEEVLAIASYIQEVRDGSNGSGSAPRGLLLSEST